MLFTTIVLFLEIYEISATAIISMKRMMQFVTMYLVSCSIAISAFYGPIIHHHHRHSHMERSLRYVRFMVMGIE